MNFKCWKCPEVKSINTPNDSVMDVLENNSENFLLKNSLYKQTHETIADFIFSIVKFDNATSLSKQNYIWYYYNTFLHRWNRGEKITSLIMNVKGPIQNEYNRYIKSLSNTGADQETIKCCKELWKKVKICN